MKSPSTDLFVLIRSLSRSEKRYFKVFASRHASENNQYAKLFEIIEKQEEYNEQSVAAAFSENIPASHFAVVKKQLYENILEALHRFDEFAHIEQKIYKGIHFCTLLLKKGLFDQCIKQIKKYKALAYELEKFENIIELIEIEKRLITKTQFSDFSYGEMEKLHAEQINCINQLQITGNYWIKSNTIFKMHYEKKIASGKENSALTELVSDPQFQKKENATTFKSKLDRLQINALHAFVHGNAEEAYHLNGEFINLIDRHKHLKLLFADRYFSALNNYLIDSLILNKTSELAEGIVLMRSLPALPEFRHIRNLEANIFRLSYLLEMNYYVSGKQFEKAVNSIPNINTGLKVHGDKIAKPNIITLRYLCAYSLFCTRNFNACQSELLLIINMKESETIGDIYRDTRMMELITHFEMGNYFLVESLIISMQRYLTANKMKYQTHRLVMRFIKNYTQKLAKPEKSKLYQTLLLLSESEEEKHLFNNFNYLHWLQEVSLIN